MVLADRLLARHVGRTLLAIKARHVGRTLLATKARHVGRTLVPMRVRAVRRAPCEGEARRGETPPDRLPHAVVAVPSDRVLKNPIGRLGRGEMWGPASDPAAPRNVARKAIVRRMATKTKRKRRQNPVATRTERLRMLIEAQPHGGLVSWPSRFFIFVTL